MFTGPVILVFSLFTIMVVGFFAVFLEDKYKILTEQYSRSIKQEHIIDIVNMAISTAQSELDLGYEEFYSRIRIDAENLQERLDSQPVEYWCNVTESYRWESLGLAIAILRDGKSFCRASNASPEDFAASASHLNYGNVISAHTLTASHQLILSYPKAVVHSSIKDAVIKRFDQFEFDNPDVYLWANEIHDFEGGDDYAIRAYHQNLRETMGNRLSTGMTDIAGNRPYLAELEGIKAHGEVFNEFYFKKKTSDDFEKKITYGKLFEPFNWVIATGIYVDDIEREVAAKTNAVRTEFTGIMLMLGATLITLAVGVVLLLNRLFEGQSDQEKKQLEVEQQERDVENYRQVLFSMLDIVEKRDSYTAGHTRRVAEYAVMIAKVMQVSTQQQDMLYESAIMHDIGKVSTPDTILLKPGKLTNQEFEIIQNHLTYGYEILRRIEAFKEHAEIMRNHHERYDGQGYPRGLKGDEIPLLSHILIVVDAFDAMTSGRTYQRRKSLDDALFELIQLKGKQFDPDVVDAAVPVLLTKGLIPSPAPQVQDEFEQARLAYYFQDPLTKLHNQNYLPHVLTYESSFRCCYFVELIGFSAFNRKHGWAAGDEKLIAISNSLQRMFPEAILFRVFGDDFLICHRTHVPLDLSMLRGELLTEDCKLDLRVHHTDVRDMDNRSLEDIVGFIEAFMHKALRKG